MPATPLGLERRAEAPLATCLPAAWGAHRGFDELLAAFIALASRGARVDVVAQTTRGAPIVRIEIPGTDQREARASLVLGGLHAMEWIGVETALALAERLTRSPASRRVVLYPLLNPDGFRRVEMNLRRGHFRFERANARGVDLNRNWPTFFRPRKPFFERLVPLLGTPGPHPGSEIEVRVVLEELERTRFQRAVSLHSFGGMLLVPFGGRLALPTDYARLHALASRVRSSLDATRARGEGRYRVRASSRWVPGQRAFGMELDHLHACGVEPLLVECGWGQLSLFDPSTWLHPFRWFNPRDPREHARRLADALTPFLLGTER